MKIVLPHRVEFGIKIRFYVPQVHAMAGPKAVYVEEGEEALYPSAFPYLYLPRRNDDDRYGREDDMLPYLKDTHRDQEVVELTRRGGPEARFIPRPFLPQGAATANVVICPRFRRYGSTKNWPHWRKIVAARNDVVAAGAPDSSYEVNCPTAWDYPRFLDASIEMIRAAKVVVATDAGLAHLAVLCGAPLILITHQGRVAPGPVLDEKGIVLHKQYWPVRLHPYYLLANHMNSSIHLVDGWDNPNAVLQEIEEIVGCA